MSDRLWIFWRDGAAWVGVWRDGRREYLRPATDADRAALSEGRISYDRETDPSTQAWEAHVRAGGD